MHLATSIHGAGTVAVCICCYLSFDIGFYSNCDTQKEEWGSLSEQKNPEFADSNQVPPLKNRQTAPNLETGIVSDLGGDVTIAQTAESGAEKNPSLSTYSHSKDDQSVSPEFDSPSHKRIEIQTDVKQLSISSNRGAAGNYTPPLVKDIRVSPNTDAAENYTPAFILRKKSFARAYGNFLVKRKFGPSRYLGSSCLTNETGVAPNVTS